MRIRIEMAFGRLTTKWRIFRRDLEFSMATCSLICRCTAKLHNFVIDQALVLGNIDEIDALDGAPRGLGYYPIHPEAIDESIKDDDTNANIEVPTGFSVRRKAIVDQISFIGLSRPAQNIARNG